MPISCPQPSFWLDVVKAFIGVFFGAGLAFASNIYFQHHERRRVNLGAGNLALSILMRQLSDFYNNRKAMLGDRERLKDVSIPYIPPWLYFRPIPCQFNDALRFDFNSLAFIFETGDREVLNALATAEMRYIDLGAYLEKHNETAELIQEKMAVLGINIANFVVETVEHDLGPVLVGRENSFANALVLRFEKDEHDYLDAINALHDALAERFGEKRVVAVQIQPGFDLKKRLSG